MKPLRIHLRYLATGQILHWSIHREPRVWLVNPEGPLSKSRYGSGWTFVDHEGYPRFTEGNWYDMLPRIRLVIENYGCELLTELS